MPRGRGECTFLCASFVVFSAAASPSAFGGLEIHHMLLYVVYSCMAHSCKEALLKERSAATQLSFHHHCKQKKHHTGGRVRGTHSLLTKRFLLVYPTELQRINGQNSKRKSKGKIFLNNNVGQYWRVIARLFSKKKEDP